MKLIIGLGNPGADYARTRHNLGFMVLDRLIEQQEWAPFRPMPRFNAWVSEVPAVVEGEKFLLAKPTTMMNLSGQAVLALANFYKVEPGDVWVVHDECDLAFGNLRAKIGGSSAGHNGVQSVMDAIGPGFVRFRVGIGPKHPPEIALDRFVLSAFSADEQQHLPQLVDAAAATVYRYLSKPDLSHQSYNLMETKNTDRS